MKAHVRSHLVFVSTNGKGQPATNYMNGKALTIHMAGTIWREDYDDDDDEEEESTSATAATTAMVNEVIAFFVMDKDDVGDRHSTKVDVLFWRHDTTL